MIPPQRPQQPKQPYIEIFGKYSLLRKIGQGGMAEVFLARPQGAPPEAPPIVIKRLYEELENDVDAVDLFLTEADVTMLLSHPNIIHVYDSGEIDGRYYMAMEYIHGRDLEQIWTRLHQKQQVLHPDAAVHIVSEMLRGLDHVHTAKTAANRPLGCVHRDVTPSNVYISTQGKIKLGDFGVAKLVGVDSWTLAGSLKGKLLYLSPEQVAGKPPSQSIDLWAAGIILYELLTGEQAISGTNELDVMLRIRAAKVPRARKINKSVPKRLEKILKRALHKKEHKRFPTAQAFLSELLDYQAHDGRPITAAELVNLLRQALA